MASSPQVTVTSVSLLAPSGCLFHARFFILVAGRFALATQGKELIPSSALVPSIPDLTVVCMLAVLIGLGLLIRGLLLLAGESPRPSPASKINEVSLGLVEISGRASGPYTITAPITSKPCYLYRTAVWQQRKSHSHEWEKVVDETLHLPFFLDDSTGQLLIEPMGANLDIRISLREEYGGPAFFDSNAVLPSVSAFLARHGVVPTRRILIEEVCIEPQSELFVTGTITENPGVEVRPLFRKKDEPKPAAMKGIQTTSKAPEIIQLSTPSSSVSVGAMTQQSRIAAALSKAGIQNPNAWAAAGVPYPERDSEHATAVLSEEAAAVVQHQQEQSQPGFNLTPALVLMKGPDDAPFVLASRNEQRRGRTSAWNPVALLSAGTALAVAGCWILFVKLHLL